MSAISSNLNYTLKPAGVPVQRVTKVTQSNNKLNFVPGESAEFKLPSTPGTVMDGRTGYLRFQVTPDKDCYIDVVGHSFIEALKVTAPGGLDIENIANYRTIAVAMFDAQVSESDKHGMSSFIGCEETTIGMAAGNLVEVVGGDTTVAKLEACLPNINRRGAFLTANVTTTLCLPLLSGLFSLSEKCWPCFALCDGTTVTIQWSTAANALVGDAVTYEISNPEIVCDYLQLSSDAAKIVASTYAGQELVLSAQTYHHYSSVIEANTTGDFSQTIPCSALSARAAFFCFNPQATQGNKHYSTGSRAAPFWSINDFIGLKLGGAPLGVGDIRTRAEGDMAPYAASLQGALHAFDATIMNGSIPRASFNAVTANGAYDNEGLSYNNGFLLGFNLDTGRNSGELYNSGINLSGQTFTYHGYIATSPTKPNAADKIAVTTNTYILHDILFIVAADGTVTSKWSK